MVLCSSTRRELLYIIPRLHRPHQSFRGRGWAGKVLWIWGIHKLYFWPSSSFSASVPCMILLQIRANYLLMVILFCCCCYCNWSIRPTRNRLTCISHCYSGENDGEHDTISTKRFITRFCSWQNIPTTGNNTSWFCLDIEQERKGEQFNASLICLSGLFQVRNDF